MKILLSTLNSKFIHSNLAIRILYQLNKEHEKLDWHEFTIKQNLQEILHKCLQYDIVTFSCYIWNITQTLIVTEELKKLKPNIKILLGGPEVSYEYDDIITRADIDYIIVGEGEIPFASFIQNHHQPALVPNLVWKDQNNVIFNKQNVNFDVKDLANINPYIDDPVETLKSKVLYLETSRGCPYKCEFCLASLDNKVRYLPLETIKNNLLFMMQHGRVIKFLDRTFNVKKDFTLDVFQFILDHHQPGNVFQFEITADILHPDIIKFINETVPKGLFRFEIGIQTVNQKANLEVSRKQNFEKTKSVIKSVEEKIELHLDLIVGLPLDYYKDIQYSFEEVFKLFAPELQLGFLKFLKGTPVRDKHENYHYKFDPNPPYQIIESDFLSNDELHQITMLEHALEIYWNKKRAIHTLKHITQNHSIFNFLTELGIYFKQKKDLYKHSLEDIYEVLFAFIQIYFKDSTVYKQLLTFDYYTHTKIKPKDILIPPLEHKASAQLIQKHKLNHHTHRFVIHKFTINPLSPNVPSDNLIAFKYNGQNSGMYQILD
jgi:anaerobic magnesium-protoporphyrin IX monomethyl ester cyclase